MTNSATPWTAARQASLSFTISLSLLKLMFIELIVYMFICFFLKINILWNTQKNAYLCSLTTAVRKALVYPTNEVLEHHRRLCQSLQCQISVDCFSSSNSLSFFFLICLFGEGWSWGQRHGRRDATLSTSQEEILENSGPCSLSGLQSHRASDSGQGPFWEETGSGLSTIPRIFHWVHFNQRFSGFYSARNTGLNMGVRQ